MTYGYYYGGANNTSASVAITSTLVLDENRLRKKVTFVNDSANTIYLSKGAVATASKGIRINANGGAYEDVMSPNGYIYKGAYNAINSVGASTLVVCEEY